jgi:hypothetical protein
VTGICLFAAGLNAIWLYEVASNKRAPRVGFIDWIDCSERPWVRCVYITLFVVGTAGSLCAAVASLLGVM